jgi:hypothetical protein
MSHRWDPNRDFDEEALLAREKAEAEALDRRADEFARKALKSEKVLTKSELSIARTVARAAIEAAGLVLTVAEAESTMRSAFDRLGFVLVKRNEIEELLSALEANGQRRAYPTDSPKVKRIKDAAQELRELLDFRKHDIPLEGRGLDEPEKVGEA